MFGNMVDPNIRTGNLLRPKMSDVDLRAARFKIDDPDAQERVLRIIPPDAEIDQLENTYRSRFWPGQPVHCSKCNGARHRDGYTALLKSGDRVLLGSVCGARHFGSWKQAKANFDFQVARQSFLVRLDALCGVASEVRSGLAKLRLSFASLSRVRSAWAQKDSRLYGILESAANYADGRLEVHERLRKDVVEKSTMQSVYRAVPIGQFRGVSFFRRLPIWLPTVIDQLGNALKKIAELHSGSEVSASSVEIAAALREVDNARQELETTHEIYRAAFDFFSDDNLHLIARFCERSEAIPDRYSIDHRGLKRKSDGFRVSLPEDCRPVDLEFLMLLRVGGDTRDGESNLPNRAA